MNTTSLLQILEEEFRDNLKSSEDATPRDYLFPEVNKIVRVAVGMRRAGKTYFLFQTIRTMLAKGIPLDSILHINFEDNRILPLDYKGMGAMIDAWYTLYPHNHDRCCYLFLDEVQNVPEWPLVIRRLLDSKNAQIYISGSSAKLLSKEIATTLRGRSLALEISPYNYAEYLTSHNVELPSKPLGKKMLDTHRSYLLDFFRIGGFPAVQSMSSHDHLATLQSYVDTVIFRDIVERHQIENVALLKYFISFLLKNISTPFSINKFYNDIKSQGHKVGKDTLYTYLMYIEDSFLLFTVPYFTESLRKSQTTPKKIYAIDGGLVLANTFNFSDNIGKLFENQVYLDLRRQEKNIFYYTTSSGYEIDFITQDHKGQHEIIQVAWETDDPATLQREERALHEAEKELGFPGKVLDMTAYLESWT